MADVKIRVENLAKLSRAFKTLGDDDAPRALKEANRQAAERVMQAALPNVPARSGALKASVRALGTPTTARMMAGGAQVPYAKAVHWGTGPRPGLRGPHNIKRRAFLWDAREKLAREVADEYERELRALVARFGGW